MEKIYLKNPKEVRKNLSILQEKLNINIIIKDKMAEIDGSALNEYEAKNVFDAINFGFSAEKSLKLIDHDVAFRIIHVRDYTRRKNLKDVVARIIGAHGRTKKTIESISGSNIVIKESNIGVIGFADDIDETITAIKSIIKGSKQANVYRYLEKRNAEKKDEGLGLK